LRITPILLIAFLCFHILEILPISFYSRAPNPKTCCGRPVCLCTHPKGAPCPFKKGLGKGDPTHQNHKFCHLKGKASRNTLFETHEPVAGAFFKRAPCNPDEPKSNIPSYPKDFDLNRSLERLVSFEPEFSLFLSNKIPLFLFDHRLDRPPRDTRLFSF